MFITTYTDHCSFHAVGRRHGPNPGGLFTKVSGSLRLAMKIVDGQPRLAQRYAQPASTGRSLGDLLKGSRGQRGHQRTGRVGIRLFDIAAACAAGTKPFFPDLPGGGTSSESKPGAGHGPHRLSPQVDGIDRRVATEDSDQPVIQKLDASRGRAPVLQLASFTPGWRIVRSSRGTGGSRRAGCFDA